MTITKQGVGNLPCRSHGRSCSVNESSDIDSFNIPAEYNLAGELRKEAKNDSWCDQVTRAVSRYSASAKRLIDPAIQPDDYDLKVFRYAWRPRTNANPNNVLRWLIQGYENMAGPGECPTEAYLRIGTADYYMNPTMRGFIPAPNGLPSVLPLLP